MPLTCRNATDQLTCRLRASIRDEEAASSNPATSTIELPLVRPSLLDVWPPDHMGRRETSPRSGEGFHSHGLLMRIGVHTVDLAVWTRAAQPNLAVQITLQGRQGRV